MILSKSNNYEKEKSSCKVNSENHIFITNFRESAAIKFESPKEFPKRNNFWKRSSKNTANKNFTNGTSEFLITVLQIYLLKIWVKTILRKIIIASMIY